MRAVTERDFRMPEFLDAKVEDYEFRSDGKIVRKDRWERGIFSIASLVGVSTRNFEIPDVIEAVRELVQRQQSWVRIRDGSGHEETPCEVYDYRTLRDESALHFDIELEDGSQLYNAQYAPKTKTWRWRDLTIEGSQVAAWREPSNGDISEASDSPTNPKASHQ